MFQCNSFFLSSSKVTAPTVVTAVTEVVDMVEVEVTTWLHMVQVVSEELANSSLE